MKSNFNELNLNDMKIVNAGYRHQGTHIGPSGPDCFGSLNKILDSAHERAISDVKLLNRLAAREGLLPIFTGDETQRHQVADFCLELDRYLFQNRRMKLS